MDEVVAVSAAIKPNYTFLVIDAMTGQDAVAHGAGLPRARSASTASSSPRSTATPEVVPRSR